MTEDRVPTPIPATIHASQFCPDRHPGMEHDEWAAMTEDRVPTTEPRYMLLRDRLIEHAPAPMVDQLIREVLAEQPAPPLDVERLTILSREMAWAAEETRQRLLVNEEHRDHSPDEGWERLTEFQRDQWIRRAADITEAACPKCGHDVDHTTACPDGCPLCLTSPRARLADKLREMYGPSLRPDDPDHDGSLTDWLRDASALAEAEQPAPPLDLPYSDKGDHPRHRTWRCRFDGPHEGRCEPMLLIGYPDPKQPAPPPLDLERLAEAWGNVMDGRRLGSERIGFSTTTYDDWKAIIAEYDRLAPSRSEPEEVNQ